MSLPAQRGRSSGGRAEGPPAGGAQPPRDSRGRGRRGDDRHGAHGKQSSKSKNMHRYKTEICRAWQEKRVCKYGEKCQVSPLAAQPRRDGGGARPAGSAVRPAPPVAACDRQTRLVPQCLIDFQK